MKVLFLGGPWHNERHDVLPSRPASIASLPAQFTVAITTERGDADTVSPVLSGSRPRIPRPRGSVTYVRRFARSNGERLPVYVSPDYHGPARA